MAWCCTSYAGPRSNLYDLWNLAGASHMRYFAIAVMWASVAAIAIFGGHDGGSVALFLGFFAFIATCTAMEN